MRASDESRILRSRQAEDRQQVERASQSTANAYQILIVRPITYLSDYPVDAQAVYACRILNLKAIEIQGGTVTLTEEADSLVFVANTGNAIPPADDSTLGIIAFRTDSGRYVMSYGS